MAREKDEKKIPKPPVVSAPEELDASDSSEDLAEEKPAVEKPEPFEVVAIMKGFYDQQRKNEGDKFTIKGKHEFSKVWMKKI